MKSQDYLEDQLRLFLLRIGNKSWKIIGENISITGTGVFIPKRKIIKLIKGKDLIKKKTLESIFGQFLGIFSIELENQLKEGTSKLIELKKAEILGSMPLVIDKIKITSPSAKVFAQKWVNNMADASFAFQKKLVKELALFNAKPENKKEILALYESNLRKTTSKKEVASYLRKKVYLSPNRAALWAQDLGGDYYRECTEKTYKESNIKQYIWITSGDKRVRPTHKVWGGTIRTVGKGIAPREEFGCRCSSQPYFGDAEKGARVRLVNGEDKVIASKKEVDIEISKIKKK